MSHLLSDLLHTLTESLPLLPFLYLTYLLMEALERYAGEKTERVIKHAGKAGPVLGALLGVIPQCGFSASGAGLYAARLITPGTLVALFLSTSDEMLPVLLTAGTPPAAIFKLLGVKVVIAIAVGFALDALLRLLAKRRTSALHDHDHHDQHDHDHDHESHIGEICRSGHCHCDRHPLPLAALIHTASVFAVIYVISSILHIAMHHGGEELIASLSSLPAPVASLLSSLVGMIPSCASSVALTQLYLDGALSVGALLSGLLTGAGAGLIVLARTNRPRKNTLALLGVLYLVGVLSGVLVDLTPLAAWLG